MSCVNYDTNKWDCTVSFINRDSLDPLIAKYGLTIFDRTRWGVVENLYQRVKGEYRVPEGYVITGVCGVMAMLSDYLNDPTGGRKVKTFYRLTHVYISKLADLYKYDGSWEANTEKVAIAGAAELGDRWESSQNPFDQKFIRGYFLSGIMLKQGFLGDVAKVMLTNVAITLEAKHFITQEKRTYTFGSPSEGITKNAGLSIPDSRVVSGFKFDCSIITFTPFYEITNIYVKALGSELPIDPSSAPVASNPVASNPVADNGTTQGGSAPIDVGPVPARTDLGATPAKIPATDSPSFSVESTAPIPPTNKATKLDKIVEIWDSNRTLIIFLVVLVALFAAYATTPPEQEYMSLAVYQPGVYSPDFSQPQYY